MTHDKFKATEDFEVELGDQIRALRIDANMDQGQLASAAGVSIGAIRNIEGGAGSSLKTLIAVCRALKKEDWLASLSPPCEVSPMQMLRDQDLPDTRQRVSRMRG